MTGIFQEHLHNKYNRYAFCFYSCETSNLFIVISQIFVVNKFLHYQFFSYGLRVYEWYSMPPEERAMMNLNPMCEVFPRLAACDYIRSKSKVFTFLRKFMIYDYVLRKKVC